MKSDPVILAIDAGGSRGRAALASGDRVIARSTAAGMNPNDIGFGRFGRRLRSLVSPLLEAHSDRPGSVRALAAIAGAGRPRVLRKCEKVTRQALEAFIARVDLKVMSDVEALTQACLDQVNGIVLIAGAGSICAGVKYRGGSRETVRVGGWGSSLDEGSGFSLGLGVLDAVLKSLDGTMDARILVDLVARSYGIEPGQVPERLIPIDRGEVASLAGIALEAYALGDHLAGHLVKRSARHLVAMVLAVRERLALRHDTAVFVSGGLFRSPVIRRLFTRGIRRRISQARITFVEDPLLCILRLAGQ